MFDLITPVSYWILIALWLVILWLYLFKFRRFRAAGGAVAVLLLILCIDALRTLFESVYFALYFNSLYGILPKYIHDVLSQPVLVIVPKLVNVVTGLLIIFLLIRRWAPRELREREAWINDLKDKEEQFSFLLEKSPLAIRITKNHGRTLVFTNPAYEEIMKADPRQKMGHDPTQFYVDANDYEEIIEELEQGRTVNNRLVNLCVRDGATNWYLASYAPIQYQGEAAFLGWFFDITERKKAEEKLTHQASHDALTGLVNRREFEARSARLLASDRADGSEHALCYMDLDQFKIVNDTCGHTAGDEMLRQLGALLVDIVRRRDTLARLGGDEFGVLMEHCSLAEAHRVTSAILNAIQDYQFIWEGRSFKIGVSMGLVPITTATTNLTDLLKDADAACYLAKDKGRNQIHVYEPGDTDIEQRHGEMQWVTRINNALQEDRFCLYAQTILPLDASGGIHYELLIRMIDETGEIIPPGAFLPAAERYDLISRIDYWVIQHAFTMLTGNPAFLSHVDSVTINLSGQSLANEAFLKFVVAQIQDKAIAGNKLCFEITETAAISNLNNASTFITTLKALGCQFALDDFGSGLSSFAYLKTLPVDFLKIDGMFVRDIADDPIDHAMIKSIHEIGQVMGMRTIAEFVENDTIKMMIQEIGVNFAQGYGIDKPRPIAEIIQRDITGRSP